MQLIIKSLKAHETSYGFIFINFPFNTGEYDTFNNMAYAKEIYLLDIDISDKDALLCSIQHK